MSTTHFREKNHVTIMAHSAMCSQKRNNKQQLLSGQKSYRDKFLGVKFAYFVKFYHRTT